MTVGVLGQVTIDVLVGHFNNHLPGAFKAVADLLQFWLGKKL